MECVRADPERAPRLMLTSVQQCRASAPGADISTKAATTGHCRSSSRREAGQTALRQVERQRCRATAGGAARCFGCLASRRGHDIAAVRRGKRRRTMRLGWVSKAHSSVCWGLITLCCRRLPLSRRTPSRLLCATFLILQLSKDYTT